MIYESEPDVLTLTVISPPGYHIAVTRGRAPNTVYVYNKDQGLCQRIDLMGEIERIMPINANIELICSVRQKESSYYATFKVDGGLYAPPTPYQRVPA
jgi:hypothetical protein